ncbi:hypothetical protein Clacol_009234 [Clathrus columnatus]|uniref:Uncharacterized protein n=1 Tax=Clathrus columnatus TaxID=1419009 RepID=A0AAV5AQI2_9AGAM|nr:hypothetical protein Clacol_009234 [Clathrus columnatus]
MPSAVTSPATNTTSHGFPYFQYVSLLGILTVLLGFSGIYLPKSTTYFTTLPPPQSSLDKPQYPLLVPITASPVLTLSWLCLGVATCQAWFGGWVLLTASMNTIAGSLLIHALAIGLGAPIFSITTPLERSIVYPCYFVFAGSWLGTVPIALDWDRPWQVWPLTPAYGALIGYIVGLWIVLGVNIFLRLAEEGVRHKKVRKDK